MILLAARTLTEVLVSLATNVALLFVCLCVVGVALLGVCRLVDFLFQAEDNKRGKVKLVGDSDFWIGWTVCTVITLAWVIDYLRSD